MWTVPSFVIEAVCRWVHVIREADVAMTAKRDGGSVLAG